MVHPIERLLDLMMRAEESSTAPPVLDADDDIVDNWVLVPRRHLRTIQSWDGEIDEERAIDMITQILADARVFGRRCPDVDVPSSRESTDDQALGGR